MSLTLHTGYGLGSYLADRTDLLQGEEKGSGVFFHDPLGRPRGRSVDSIPNRLAIRRTQPSSPKGRPRCTLTRSASSSDAV